MKTTLCLEMIGSERERQNSKHPEPLRDTFHGMLVLMEEVGEAAQAIEDGSYEEIVSEITQVAAVAVRIMEELL